MKAKNNIRKFNLLISIALIGILIMQSIWIINSIRIEEKKYKRELTKSLNNIARNFQVHQNISNSSSADKKHILQLKSEVRQIEKELENTELTILKKKIVLEESIAEIEQTIVVKFESDSLLSSIIQRIPPPPATPAPAPLPNNFHSIIEDILFEFKFSDKDIEERLENVNIDEIIAVESENNRLSEDIVFYIHENEDMIWSSHPSQLAISENDQGVHLFPFSELSEKAFIRYKAPSKLITIAKRVWLQCFLSLLFTLFIIYAYSKTLKLYKLQLQLNNQKNDFINNMGHEFKTPIATIQLAAQTLQHEKIAEDSTQAIPLSKHIIRESKRLQQYIERILSSAQLESSSFSKLHIEPVDISSLIHESLEQLELIINQKKAIIRIEPSDQIFALKADRLLLTGVFRNIIENSLKYSDEEVHIDIFIKRKNGQLIIDIKDNGYGMNRHTLSLIFQQFYRLSKGNIHDIKGLGLGLYFAKQVIENHGGKITVQSELNEGTTFSIQLDEEV